MEEARIWWEQVRAFRLRSQIVTLKRGQHIKYRPYAFTEHGILMLSSVLNSERAVQVNIEIARKSIEKLISVGIIKQVGGSSYGKTFVAEEILQIIGEGTEQ